jgi:hypothetical protein
MYAFKEAISAVGAVLAITTSMALIAMLLVIKEPWAIITGLVFFFLLAGVGVYIVFDD